MPNPPTTVGPLQLYITANDGPGCQSVSPTKFTNESWAELFLRYVNAPLTQNNINNVLLWMSAGTPPSSWWGLNNDPLSGGPLGQILDTIRDMETPPNGDYTSMNYGTSGASGAYQIEQSTWQSFTKLLGVGTEYDYAAAAPPAIQDLVAAGMVLQILQQNGNNVRIVPLFWYTGNAQGTISAKDLAANNGLLPSTYQTNWMNKYNSLSPGFPTSGSNYKSLGAAAYWDAWSVNNLPQFEAIKNALMNDAITTDFSQAVVLSSWDGNHYGVPIDGDITYSAPNRDANYFTTLPAPNRSVVAPSSHGMNVSPNSTGLNWATPQQWRPKKGVQNITIPDQMPDLTSLNLETLPGSSDQLPGALGPMPSSGLGPGGGTGGISGTSSGSGGAGSTTQSPGSSQGTGSGGTTLGSVPGEGTGSEGESTGNENSP
jgi:hypothetical protein